MRNPTLLLLCLPLLLGQTCTLTSDLDKYDNYSFGDKNKSDAGKDGGKDAGEPDADDAGETWWQRYDRLSGEASPECAEMAEEHLYCTGGVQLEVDLTCPDHCHAVTGRHCFCPYKREYQDAAKICQSTDMHLVKIDDREENEALGGLMLDMGISSDERTSGANSVAGAAWIGLTDLDEEGVFVWPDGSEPTYEARQHNQPDNLTGPEGEDCVAMQVAEDERFLWYDYPCEIYAGIETGKRPEATHFFFCETKDTNKKIGQRSTAFIDNNTSQCQRPAIPVPGETCCTTVADVATNSAVELGRCGAATPGFGSSCSQFCRPGKADYESGCPENTLGGLGLISFPPCCTTLGNDGAGYLCGLFWAPSGCFPNAAATTSCPKPTAYKGPDEPLYTEWKKCGDEKCMLAQLNILSWADQCCTDQEDVQLLWAVEPGQCGLRIESSESNPCVQLDQKGEPDDSCPTFYLLPDSPYPEFDSFSNPGCCTEYGVCGEMDNTYYGCSVFRNDMETPYQLCRRANKDENIGFDPLLSEINYAYRNEDTGLGEIRSKNYGNCDGPIQYNNNSYYFCQGPLEWEQARAACEWKKDRCLVHIDDAKENDFLHERFKDDPFWIGAYMNDKSVMPDDWLWSDTDEPFFIGYGYQCEPSGLFKTWEEIGNSYVNWAGCDNFPEDQAQPNDDQGIEEKCAQMRPDGYWSSEDCAIRQAYVCEEKG